MRLIQMKEFSCLIQMKEFSCLLVCGNRKGPFTLSDSDAVSVSISDVKIMEIGP